MHFQLLTALTLLSITTALPSQSTPQGPPQAGLGHPPSFTLPDAEAVPALPVPGGKPVYNPAQNKRGLAFNDVKYIQSFWGAGTKVNWMYNWDSRIPTGAPYVQFVPMLWGDGPAHTTNWFGNAQDSINRGANNILGFNEPDQCFNSGQSCIGPEQAANSYRKYIQPFGNQAWLGSPAITNSADGTRWITAFLNNYCRDCQVDFVNMHWYGGTNAQEFIGWVQMVKGLIGGRRIWITEFNGGAFTGATETQQIQFMKEVLPWLDRTDYVERYAWHMVDPAPTWTHGSLSNLNGQPSLLGWNYAYNIPRG